VRGQQPGQRPARGAWKADPAKAGPGGTLADIGTHAFHLLRHVTGLEPDDVSCQLRSYFPGRQLDDYAHAVLRFPQGALGTITLSQVTHGRLNDLTLEVDGTSGSLCWRQEDPERLVVRRYGHPVSVYERNPRVALMHEAARGLCRLPGGHPEGYFEAFANIYREVFDDIVAHAIGAPRHRRVPDYASVRDGVEGVRFVEQCLASHRDNGAWKPLHQQRVSCGRTASGNEPTPAGGGVVLRD
jgi:predicted dehydrogenase